MSIKSHREKVWSRSGALINSRDLEVFFSISYFSVLYTVILWKHKNIWWNIPWMVQCSAASDKYTGYISVL